MLIKHIDEHIGHKAVQGDTIENEPKDLNVGKDSNENERKEVDGLPEVNTDGKVFMNTPIEESLHSCDKCDYDSDKIEDLKEHKAIGIHNIHYHNVTIDLTEENCKDDGVNIAKTQLNCGFCEYKTRDLKDMQEHGKQEHGTTKCERCEYSGLTKELMEKHMTSHTGRNIFTCCVCEFEATRQVLLNQHLETKHRKSNKSPNSVMDVRKSLSLTLFLDTIYANQNQSLPANRVLLEQLHFLSLLPTQKRSM